MTSRGRSWGRVAARIPAVLLSRVTGRPITAGIPRPSRRTLLVAACTVVAVCAVAGWVVLRSGVFSVRIVTVAGTARLTTSEVTEAARVEPGSSLALLNVDAVARRIGRLPVVRKVEVVRDWPHTVTITVTERQAVAVRRQARDHYLLVDSTGAAFATVRKKPKGLPLITVRRVLDSMGRFRPDPAALESTLAVLADVPAALRPHVIEVRAAGPDDVTVRLTRGRTVVWGAPTRGARKGQVLAVLATRKAKVYDISAPDAPTTRK